MSHYRHKRISIWRLLGSTLRSLGGLIKAWPLLVLIAIVVSPITPHLLWEYSYNEYGNYRVYTRCTYIGKTGAVPYMQGDHCPVIAFINTQSR